MKPIEINSHDYICWHEAGHIVAAIEVGAIVKRVVVTPDQVENSEKGIFVKGSQQHVSVEYSEAAEIRAEQRKYVACGGWAAEYFLYKNKLILNSGNTPLNEKEFIEKSNENCRLDKLVFMGEDQSEGGTWPEQFDRDFMDFGIGEVYPILVECTAQLHGLWKEITQKQKLTQKDIELIIPR